ncbi:MAG TPA: hypothetical protein VIL00_15060 [Pseudonocardiaceae bacterium]
MPVPQVWRASRRGRDEWDGSGRDRCRGGVRDDDHQVHGPSVSQQGARNRQVGQIHFDPFP